MKRDLTGEPKRRNDRLFNMWSMRGDNPTRWWEVDVPVALARNEVPTVGILSCKTLIMSIAELDVFLATLNEAREELIKMDQEKKGGQ